MRIFRDFWGFCGFPGAFHLEHVPSPARYIPYPCKGTIFPSRAMGNQKTISIFYFRRFTRFFLKKILRARAKKKPKKRVGRAPFWPAPEHFGVHAFFFENLGLFPRKSFRKNVFSAGIAGAQNRVS